MTIAQRKVRSWCEECEAWHPPGKHVTEPKVQSSTELRAEPRPISSAASVSRGSGWLRLALFIFVILPVGVVAWSAAIYAVLLLWPQIRAALP
jgi:hypothetical protein